ncbi:DUF1672 domain-containing protein [Pseudalkalibacillus decolorationis]|uniref:DUF1672 domain-containing protein n=1 Tax=Pseudalkalibacillus decolorationis TaxID=163879 RepID=UPI0021496C2F|nr:DUF1672 domain-containing protein [Pseudalkalibacillus decolorationis]
MGKSNDNNDKNIAKEEKYVSVQEYTGQGYELNNGEETDKIAEAHREEIDKAVKAFFLEKYKTEVKVHNVVGAAEGASVFVESVGEPHFYTYAIVPIDVKEKEVLTEKVWSKEEQVEDAIKGGLYALLFEEEFNTLDEYLKTFSKKNDVVGKREESLENVGGTGYMTPYYYITTSINDDAIKPVYELYLKNPTVNKNALKKAYNNSAFSEENFKITIQLFMEDKEMAPSEKIFNQVCDDLEKMNTIPKGSYSVVVNDNRVDKTTDTGYKDNSLKRAYPNYILKIKVR